MLGRKKFAADGNYLPLRLFSRKLAKLILDAAGFFFNFCFLPQKGTKSAKEKRLYFAPSAHFCGCPECGR